VIVGVVLVAAPVAAYVGLAVVTSDTPPPAHLAPPPPAVESVASAAETSTPAATGDPKPTRADGVWVVRRGTDTFAGYRMHEHFAFLSAPNDAVGRTPAVDGTLTIRNGRIVAARLRADVRQLQSGIGPRDEAVQRSGLETDRYPRATFVLTQPVDLQGAPRGRVIRSAAAGRLTMHGVTGDVTFEMELRWNGATFQVAGRAPVNRADFGLRFDNEAVVHLAPAGSVEAALTLVRRGDGSGKGSPASLAGAQPAAAAAWETLPAATDPTPILFVHAPGEGRAGIFAGRADGVGVTSLTAPDSAADSAPTVSPDGSTVVFARTQLTEFAPTPATLVAFDRKTGREAVIWRQAGVGAKTPSWSPDGRKIVFVTTTPTGSPLELTVLDVKSLQQRTIVTPGGLMVDKPSWSPDGREIAFTGFAGGNEDLYVIGVDGGQAERLTTGAAFDDAASWSPDGESLVYTSGGNIMVLERPGDRASAITSGTHRLTWPRVVDAHTILAVDSAPPTEDNRGVNHLVLIDVSTGRLRKVPLEGDADQAVPDVR
jgi:polyisoprenoid-binding protein YceI